MNISQDRYKPLVIEPFCEEVKKKFSDYEFFHNSSEIIWCDVIISEKKLDNIVVKISDIANKHGLRILYYNRKDLLGNPNSIIFRMGNFLRWTHPCHNTKYPHEEICNRCGAINVVFTSAKRKEF